MIGLLQRVTRAQVTVGDRVTGVIGSGLLVLVGIQKGDSTTQADRLLERLVTYRVFDDADGRMNLSLEDTGGGLLLVPQFTLAAETHKGTRPGFSTAAPPDEVVLMQVGEVLAKSIRRGDILARWGGEEFILLLPENDLDAAAEFAERMRTAIVQLLIARDDIRLQVTASFGVGQLVADQDLNGLIHRVDKLLYLAKGAGRNRVMKADAVRAGLDVPALQGAGD